MFPQLLFRFSAMQNFVSLQCRNSSFCNPFFTSARFPLVISEFNSVEWNSLPWFAIWRMTYVVVGTTFFTYLFNTYALKTLSPTTVGSFIYLQPIITIIFALATGNDSLDFTKVFACLLVFLGVYMVSKKNYISTFPS